MSKSAISHTAEEWLALDFLTDQSQIVAGTPEQAIIRVGTKNVIEAPEKSFKTTFMLRFMLGLSCGKTVYPLLPVPTKRKVLYLHGELAPAEIQERTRAASAGLLRPLDNLVECRDISMHFKQPTGREAITEAISKHQPNDVVFDPWQAFITGEDENQFKDVSEALHFIDGLIDKFKITVFLVTHVGKDRSRGTRGSSCIAGWRDTLIKLTREKNNTIKVTVDPRWAAPLEPFHLKFDKGMEVRRLAIKIAIAVADHMKFSAGIIDEPCKEFLLGTTAKSDRVRLDFTKHEELERLRPPLSHFAFVKGNGETHTSYAIVQFYGLMQFYVLLNAGGFVGNDFAIIAFLDTAKGYTERFEQTEPFRFREAPVRMGHWEFQRLKLEWMKKFNAEAQAVLEDDAKLFF